MAPAPTPTPAPAPTSPGATFGGVTRIPLGTAVPVSGAYAVPGVATPVSGPYFAPESPTGDEGIPWWLILLFVGGAVGIVYSTKGGAKANPRSNPNRSVTFGTIPSATELQEALDREGGWSMTLRGSDERVFDAAMRQARITDAISLMQTGSGMRQVLSALMSYANRKANTEYRKAGKPSNFESSEDVQTAESLASSIAGILGWEWI